MTESSQIGKSQTRAARPASRGRQRQLSGAWAWIENVLLFIIIITVLMWIMSVHEMLRIELYPQQFMAVWLGLCLAAVYLGYRPTKGAIAEAPPWYDIALAVLSLVMGIFVCSIYLKVETVGGYIDQWWIAALSPLALFPILEACRRTGQQRHLNGCWHQVKWSPTAEAKVWVDS